MFAMLAAAAPLLAAVPATDTVTEADLRPHIATLASDAYGGRAPGTEGETKTIGYIAAELARAGFAPGGPNGSWYQPVTLVRRTPYAANVVWRARKRPLALAESDLLLIARERSGSLERAPVVFAGYGLEVGDALRGAVALILRDPPPGNGAAIRADERRARVVAAGAAAVLTIVPDANFTSHVEQQRGRGPTRVADDATAPVEGAIAERAARELMRAAGANPDALLARAAEPGFRPVPLAAQLTARVSTQVQRFTSHNVVGVLRGTTRADEHVALTGHWDHLGACRGDGAPDRICNGAVDNASGIAAMLEVAERLGRAPRRTARSILFVATTAEEMGLLGARAFVKSPPVPLASIVALFNIDTLAIGPRGAPVGIVGRGKTALDATVDGVAARLGRASDRDEEANGFYTRQDGYEFVRAGVPAVMAGGGFTDMARLQRFLRGTYHGPDDEYSDTLELGGAAEDATLHVALARAFADPAIYPTPAREPSR